MNEIELLTIMRDALDPLLFVAGDGMPPDETFQDDDTMEGVFTVGELRNAFAAIKAYAKFTEQKKKINAAEPKID